MNAILEDLKKNIQGEVSSSAQDLQSYETDESIFKIHPQITVSPKNEQDVIAVVEIASIHKIPITARGGGTSVAGQSIGSGIILDFSKHMNQILDVSGDYATVQPGVVLADLNQRLLSSGMKFAPDPGSWLTCTIGGMISTNAAGPHALVHGSTRDHVDSLELILSNGKKTDSKLLSKDMQLYVSQITKHAELIKNAQPNVDKNSSGYYLEGLLEKPASFEKLIVGSEGTLAMVTAAKLKLISIPQKVSFAIFGFDSIGKALMKVKPLRESGACCIELLDSTILNVFQKEDSKIIHELGLGNANASLWVEWNSEIPSEFKKEATFTTIDSKNIARIWSYRSKSSKWLHAQAEKQNRKPLRCIEDACVPIDTLVGFVMGIHELMDKYDCRGAVFGHVGNGHLHVNPSIKINTPDLELRVQNLMDEFYELVFFLGGTVSGEHGDGILRVPYAKRQWKSVWPLFEFIKKSFDPKGIFNPDKKVPITSHPWPKIKYETQ